jgi:hypothetical protein
VVDSTKNSGTIASDPSASELSEGDPSASDDSTKNATSEPEASASDGPAGKITPKTNLSPFLS